MENIYDVLIESDGLISQKEGRPYKDHQDLLENMVFTNSISQRDDICVDFEGRLYIGRVKSIDHYPAINGKPHSKIIIRRDTIPKDDRFPRFVQEYGETIPKS